MTQFGAHVNKKYGIIFYLYYISLFSHPSNAVFSDKQNQDLLSEWNLYRSSKNKFAKVKKKEILNFIPLSQVLQEHIKTGQEFSLAEFEAALHLPHTGGQFYEQEFQNALFVVRMNNALDTANEFRFMTMDMAEKLCELSVFEKERRKEYLKQEAQEFTIDIHTTNAAIAKLNEENKAILVAIRNLEKEKEAIDNNIEKKVKSIRNIKQRMSKKIELRNEKKFDFELIHLKISHEKGKQQHTENLLRIHRQGLERCYKALSDIENEVTVINVNGEFEPFSDDFMLLFRLFEKNINEDKFISILESIGRDLFLGTDYFMKLDDAFLEKQKAFCASIITFIQSHPLEEDVESGLTKEHALHFQKLLEQIYLLHELEQSRRLLKISPPKSPHIIKTNSASANEIIIIEQIEEEISKEETKLEEWSVTLRNQVIKYAAKNNMDEEISALVNHLKIFGPYLHKQNIVNDHWRNFSALTDKDFHCHLGHSNNVVVWRVIDNQDVKEIVIYYMGNHPSTYKRIIKRAPKVIN